ncbi:MAG: hypothetical protein KCHDKBKB_01490 [Elusimicrobia bacterium]|nr:hypothetical protein [Elusimicrobiota bacterium]
MSLVARRLIEGSLLNSLTLLLGIVISFFMMPYMVTHLGDHMYGIWTIVAEFLWYYGLLDFGLSSAIGRFLSRAIGRKDAKEIQSVTATAFYLTVGLGFVAMMVTFLFTLKAGWIVKDANDLSIFRILLFIVGINFACEFPVRVFNAVLGANLRFDIRNIITIIKNLLIPFLVVLAIRMGWGVIGIAWVTLLASIGDSIVRIYMARRIEPSLSLAWSHVAVERIRQLFGYSVYAFVGKIADILRFKIDLFIISSMLGLSAVTHYFIGARLLDYFMKFVSSSVEVIAPVFSQDDGRNNYDAIRGNLFFVTKISSYLALFLGGGALFFGQSFIERWMGPGYPNSYRVLVILIIPAILALVQSPGEHLLYSVSKHRFLAFWGLAEGMVNALISIYMAKSHGILGVAFGTAIPMFIRYMAQPLYVSRQVHLPLFSYSKMILDHMFWGALFIGLGWMLSRPFVQPDYFKLTLGFSVMTLIYWPMVLFFKFDKKEREKFLSFFRFSSAS